MNNKKLANRIRSLVCFSLLPVLFTLLMGCSSGGDSAPPPPTINIANASVLEGDGGTSSLVFTVTASAAVGSGASVQYTTSNGTATAGTDYTASSGTLNFTQGSTTATITILVTGDTLLESDETLTLTLSTPANLTLGTTIAATGTITNDDATTFNGYFSGSATVDTSVNITDLIGLAYDDVGVTGKRLMLFSRSGASNVLYDIAITNNINNDYTGTATVYINGSSAQTGVAVTATINGSQITGTLAGTGLGLGSFDIVFDTANNAGATLARIDGNGFNNWTGNIYGYDVDTSIFGAFQNNGLYFGRDDTTQMCEYSSTLVLPDNQLNIYQLTHNITNPSLGTCASPYISTGHTGLASVITTTTTDDTLVYAFSNGTIALFAVMSH